MVHLDRADTYRTAGGDHIMRDDLSQQPEAAGSRFLGHLMRQDEDSNPRSGVMFEAAVGAEAQRTRGGGPRLSLRAGGGVRVGAGAAFRGGAATSEIVSVTAPPSRPGPSRS